MENLKIKGQIEVRLEDKNGNIKYREVKDNTITGGFLRWWLQSIMNGGPMNTVSRGAANGALRAQEAMQYPGIYLMKAPVNVKKNTFIAPYTDITRKALHPDVVFYNQNAATTETSAIMLPVDSNCGFVANNDEISFQMEYTKNTYIGDIRSVVIGNGLNAITSQAQYYQGYLSIFKDFRLPVDFYQSGLDGQAYLMEHTLNGTLFYQKFSSSVNPFYVNLKTKDIAYFGDAATNMNTNIGNSTYVGGLIVNDTVFKAIKGTVSGSTYNITLQGIKNWKAATAAATLATIPFVAKTGMSLYSSAQPVLVGRPGENTLEIFVTTSVGNHDGAIGANVQKAIVNVSDVSNITYTIEDMGVIPYIIGVQGTDRVTHNTGLYFEEKYYLPYYGMVDPNTGSAVVTAQNYYSEGGIFDEDLNLVDLIPFRAGSAQYNSNPVIADAEEVLQFMCAYNSSNNHRGYMYFSSIVSGTNLDQTITKGPNDILRVIYRYTMA